MCRAQSRGHSSAALGEVETVGPAHSKSSQIISLCESLARKVCLSCCVCRGGESRLTWAGVGWGQLPLGNIEALGGAGRGPQYVTTSIRSRLSSPWGVMCQQAAIGLLGRDSQRQAFLLQASAPSLQPPTLTPCSCSLQAVLQGSRPRLPGGRGLRPCASRGRVPPGHPGVLLLTRVLPRATQ